MGNKLGRRRQVVDEKYTRPQGLYQHKDVDHKKLRKLILDSKLAPCYPGDEECAFELEECPICFLYYPSLNRSRCCTKGICTECFLQMKPPHSTRPTQCPFCKTSNYAVEYRGMRSKEEKGMEQVEEQRVIEAKIRMQRQELQDEEERMQRRQDMSSSSRIMTAGEVGYTDVSSSSLAVPSFSSPVGCDEIVSSHNTCSAPIIRQPSRSRQNRENQFDLDLEDIMVMEAIWLSIQESDMQRNLAHDDASHSEPLVTEDRSVSQALVPLAGASSPSGGLACAIAALAERQHMDWDSTNDTGNNSLASFDMLPDSGNLPRPGEERLQGYNVPENWIEVSPDSGRALSRGEEGEWGGIDHGSEVAEAGTSYASSDAAAEVALPLPDGSIGGDQAQPNMTGSILPESFEEQMMLAMAVSLAEARARSNAQGVAWL
ncbi:hypothetical protein BVC80_7851g3 [Macleaya cordata]|uniref:Zinc finger protein n=1 Tax=Macleaya cordata TaxID=56857 RepID=A0A200PYW1_MACCD|nr:hypothetical protein BVC80_7851g3 [Macleaya cordata]